MTAARLRTAAAKLREEGGARNVAVADWLDAVAEVHWPKRSPRNSSSHYNAEPEHDILMGDCDETCWVEAYICNGCGTAKCRPEISGRALAVADAVLGAEVAV